MELLMQHCDYGENLSESSELMLKYHSAKVTCWNLLEVAERVTARYLALVR